MKRIIFIMLLSLAGCVCFAQQQRHIKVHKGGVEILNKAVSATDSIKLQNGTAVFHLHDATTWQRLMSGIDSVTFAYETEENNEVDTTIVDNSEGIFITWVGDDSVQIINSYADSGVAITANKGYVTVNSSATISDLVYNLKGTSHNGALVVNSDKKLILSLNGLNLHSADGAAIIMESDKRCVLHLMNGTTNVVSDTSTSGDKGALQFKGKLEIQGSGTLSVSGYAKHGIQSSGEATMLSGNVNVLTAAKDGMNVDCFVMEGGNLNVSSLGDGIDGDQGTINVNGGTITVRCASDDVKAMGCDGAVTINGGNVDIVVSGAQSKGIKTDASIVIEGGSVSVEASGSVVLEESGSGYDASYCTGLKADKAIVITDGEVVVSCPSSNAGGKCFSADSVVTIVGGSITLSALGASAKYTNADGEVDYYASTCIKSDGDINISGGTLRATAYGKCLSADSNISVSEGSLCLKTTGNGAILVGSGTNATDGYVSSCIKADGNIELLGGEIYASSTGVGGRGISANGNLTVGAAKASNDVLQIYVTTSGAAVNASGSREVGGQSTTDYFKGLPKGIRIEGDITINSGRLSVYCSQTSGSAEGIESKGAMYINGGEIEASAYDDAINAGSYLEINDGKIWAYSRNNDAIDCNVTNNTACIHGGLIIAIGSEEGLDMNTEQNGRYSIDGGYVLVKKGTMGFWDNPSSRSIKYVLLSAPTSSGTVVKDASGNIILAVKAEVDSGNGFQNTISDCAAKPGPSGPNNPGDQGGGFYPGGQQGEGTYMFLSPDIKSGTTYSLYTTATISGGTSWHGVYTGATATVSGSATTLTVY